jgi:hypothetical protein
MVIGRRIAGLTFVCNEDDILEQFVRHNIRFVDVLHVFVDIKSVDNSRKILTALLDEGLPLVLEDAPAVHDIDPRALFVQRNDYWAYVFIDDDEFLGGIAPDHFLSTLRRQEITSQIWLPWKTYLPNESCTPKDPIKLQKRRAREEPQYYKAVYIRAGIETPHHIAEGAHSVTGIKEVWRIQGAFLAHYPVRSYRQILLKYTASQFQHLFLLKFIKGKTHGWHLNKGFEDLVTKTSFSYEDLLREAYYYCSKAVRGNLSIDTLSDPVEVFGEKRYPVSTESDLELILKLVSNVFNVFRQKKA